MTASGDCPEFERTSAFIDGELDGDAAMAAERHIETCAHCQAFVAAAAEASEALRGPSGRYKAPELLRARIGKRLDAEAKVMARGSSLRPGFWRGVASGVGASGVIAASLALLTLPPTAGGLAREIGKDHVNALMAGKTIEVVSTDHHTVKPWFAGRAPLSPPVTDFKDQGYPLAGGRLAKVGGRTAAVVVYRHGLHEIDLYVWADRGGSLPQASDRRGYHLVFWRAGDLDFAAASDVAPGELSQFVSLVQTQRE